MQTEPLWWVLVVLVSPLLSALGTRAMIAYARRHQLIDHPDPRRSHQQPTPRGGGLGLVAALGLSWLALWSGGQLAPGLAPALLLGGVGLALVGLWDDHCPLSRRLRLAVQLGSAALALHWLGVPPLFDLAWPMAGGLALLGLVWWINLYNFMDGIDGFAGVELFCLAGAAAVLLAWQLGPEAAWPALAAATAALGFLRLNWPPARIFMGDVGSLFAAYVCALLALWGMQAAGLSLWVWLILGAAFIVDASVTLLRRLFAGARIQDPHRSHLYQRLARRAGGHRPVTLGLLAVNLLWLLPLAVAATAWPALGPGLWLLAWAPLLAACVGLGAGRAGD